MKARKLAKKLDRPIDWRIAKKEKAQEEKQQARLLERQSTRKARY